VPVGVVGRAHGLDGSFFVEGPSEREDVFALRATLYVDGERSEVVSSKRGSHGRPVIRLDRRVERGTLLEVERVWLPPTDEGEYYAFELVGLRVAEENGPELGTVKVVSPGVANDVLELDSGLLLPMVEDCVLRVDLEARRIVVAPGYADLD